jgi:NDP-sugar pyrophosphorylase family protein
VFDWQRIIERAAQLPPTETLSPWEITADAEQVVRGLTQECEGDDWVELADGVAHVTATVSEHAYVEGPVFIGPYCEVGPGTQLRGGVWLEKGVTIGSNAEVKASFVFAAARIAHLNYVGNSFLGEDVNLEAGAVLANHWNERNGESIFLRTPGGERIQTGVAKFGAIVGDGARIGANAVTSPGTVLAKNAVVDRLELIR